tara:strand:+ start:251 stop:640 length:390 start_codon:yes stop_codon:yes gene_type:complete
MSYSTKEVWIPCDSQSQALSAASESAVLAIKSGTADVARGLLYGVKVRVSAADAGNAAVDFRAYTDSSKTQLIYSVIFDFTTANVGSEIHDADTLATPFPVFATPYFTVTPGAATALTFTATYMMKALA